MDNFDKIIKEKITFAANGAYPEKNLTARAKARAEKKISFRPRMIIASASAAVLMCSTAVAAANFGWLDSLFGSSSAIITESYEYYRAEVTNLKTEYNDAEPDVIFDADEFICDGEMLYMSYTLTVNDEEMIDRVDEYLYLNRIGDDSVKEMQTFTQNAIGRNKNVLFRSVGISTAHGINEGDRFSFSFGYYDIEIGEEIESVFTVSFDIADIPEGISKTVNIGKDVVMGSEECTLEKIIVSPLRIQFLFDEDKSLFESDNVYDCVLNMKDGTAFTVGRLSKGASSGEYSDKNENISYNSWEMFFDTVVRTDDIESISVGDITIDMD